MKDDVYLDARSGKLERTKASSPSNRTIVRETEQKSREENCGGADLPRPGPVPTPTALLNDPWLWAVGAGVVAVVACLGLCHSDDPISPARPSGSK